jgi:hypothetical protein
MALFAELKRRNVFRVAAAYAVVGWMVVQVTSVFGPALHAPEWVVSFFAFVAVIGFPIALAFAWIYEYTPQGLKRTEEVPARDSIAHLTGQKPTSATGRGRSPTTRSATTRRRSSASRRSRRKPAVTSPTRATSPS